VSYATGIVLDGDVVEVLSRWLDGTSSVEQLPPSIYLEGGRVLVGEEAQSLGASRPSSLLDDVVSQFDKDRTFLTGGQLLSPVGALGLLLSAVAGRLSSAHAGPPGAVSIACPLSWGSEVLSRVADAAGQAGLPLVAVLPGRDPSVAATDALTRLPRTAVTEEGGATVAQSWGGQPDSGGTSTPIELTPDRTEPSAGRWRAVVSLAALVVLAGGAVLFLAVRPAPSEGEAGATTTTDLSTTPPTSSTSSPRPPLVIGVLSTESRRAMASSVIDTVNRTGGVLDQDVVMTHMALGSGAGEVEALMAAGPTVIVAESADPVLLQQVATATQSTQIPVCAPAEAPVSGDEVAFVGSLERCIELFALAAQSVESSTSSHVAQAATYLTGGGGRACATYPECRELIELRQTISYRPGAETLRQVGAT
jgi:hypothetical protein